MTAQRLALDELHKSARASFEDARGWRLPAFYGGPEPEAVAREYSAAREAAALVDLSDRGVLAVTGPLRQKFLHNILSNDVLSRQPGQGRLAALMNVKGHLLAFMRVLVGKDAVFLEMASDRLQLVEETLLFYKVASPVRFQTNPVVVLGLLGPQAREVLRKTGCEIAELAMEDHAAAMIAGADALVARASDLPGSGLVIHLAPENAAAVWEALGSAGALPLGREALDALRIEEGRPWYGPDVTEENLLHETGLVAAYHSPTKGCYVGQEVMARLDARGGHVNKMLRGLRLSAPTEVPAPVLAEGKEAGRVTTAAVSPRLGPIALAYVHRKHFEPGSSVEVGGAPATVATLPLEG